MLHPSPPASPVTEHHLAPEISFQRTRSHSNRSLLKGLALFSRMRMTQKPLACQKERVPNLTPTPNLMLVLENTPSPAPSLPTVPLTSPLLDQEALFQDQEALFQDMSGTPVPVTGSPLSRPALKRIGIALQDFSVSGISEAQSNLGTLQSASSLLALALLSLGPKTSINPDGQREQDDPPYEDPASEPEINLSAIWADYLSLSQASLDTKYTASALPAGESACIAPSPSLDWPSNHSTATDHDQEPDVPTLPSTNTDFRDAMAELSLALSQLPRTPYNSPDAVSFLPNSGSSMVRLSSVLARLVAEGLGALGPQALSSSVAIVEDGDDASRVEEGEDAEETNATCVKHGLDAQAEEGDSTHANVSHDRGDARMSLGLVDGAKPETGALQEHMDGPTESESQPLDLGSMLVLFPSPPQQPFEWLVEESCSTPRTPRRGQRRQGATFSWLDDKQCGELRGLGICV